MRNDHDPSRPHEAGFAVYGQSSRRRYSLLPIITTAITIVIFLTGGLSLIYLERLLVARAGENLSLAAVNAASALDRLMAERYGDMRIIAASVVAHDQDVATLSEYFRQVKATLCIPYISGSA